MHPTVNPIRTLKNNYTWLLSLPDRRAAIIDPGEFAPVSRALAERKLTPTLILLTHHHPDHCGAAAELKKLHPQAVIAIHADDAKQVGFTVDRELAEGDSIPFGDDSISVMHLPCHTRGCVAYRIAGRLFTGDTLFAAGCGKFFEGPAAEMKTNLDRLKGLPGELEICCGHEYTVENLAYALKAEPGNRAVAERLQQARIQENSGGFPLPARLAIELRTNPFLRLDDPALQQALGTGNELDTLLALYEIYYQQTPPHG